ncbi:MAG TPA: maleylpyruvate isomerase N-terminal domain-containing protein [Pseudonocardiaceae bacterium]|nr:maleylpyruvate isomerase N-terminal domain-containing protein [Pseudonocardiaceae bacterium]
MGDLYGSRVDALEQSWQLWAQLGAGLTADQWSTATRCPGWDVAALYAHHSLFPRDLSVPLPPWDAQGQPMTAGEVLRRFNASDGLAHTVAETVAAQGVSEAAAHTRTELIERFTVHGPQALRRLRQAKPTLVVPWPESDVVITLREALRIVVLEATVHLLDVQRALGQPPVVPPLALKDTVQVLAELAPAVEFIEAATGRSTHSPLPVLR